MGAVTIMATRLISEAQPITVLQQIKRGLLVLLSGFDRRFNLPLDRDHLRLQVKLRALTRSSLVCCL